MEPVLQTRPHRPVIDRFTLRRNYRGLLQRFNAGPDPEPGPPQPVKEPPHETPPVREPETPQPPRPTPVPGTPSITPPEFPKHPGGPPLPGRQHPTDPDPPQPIDLRPIRVLRALWLGRAIDPMMLGAKDLLNKATFRLVR
ncbi:MAG: hypothetical protein ABI599_07200 [Flavobacteriales bacterium]